MGHLALMVMAASIAAPASAIPAPARLAADGDTMKLGAAAWEAGDFGRALDLWRPLAKAGDPDAQYNLAQAYRLGRGVAADQAQALDWYFRAAKQGHPEAQGNYGLMLFQDGKRAEALPWLEKAAGRGDARAQYVLGTALFNGDIAGRNWVRAYAMMTRAVAAGLPQARTSLAEMDRFVPLGQRQQGVALARDLARGEVLTNAGAAPAGILVKAADNDAASIVAPPRAAPSPAVRKVADVRTSPGAIAAAPPVRTPPGAVVAPGAGGWRVQLGAYATAAAADAAWRGVATRMPGLALRPYPVRAGAVTRLQAGPLASRADAARACARITAATGTPCFPALAR